MRLTTVIIIASLLQVSASSFGQRISLHEKNTSLKQVLKKIRVQSGYNIFFPDKVLAKANAVTVNLSNVPLTEALDKVLENQPLQYEIKEKNIVLSLKEKTFLESVIVRFQTIDVRGRVVDERGNGLSGAGIKVKNGKGSATSNANGEFSLTNVDEDAVLVVSYVGYKNLEVIAKADLGILSLEVVAGELQEVVINKGYYTQKQDLNTGSVGTLTAADIAKQPISNPLTALQGRIPGIYVAQTSGISGGSVEVNIRGRNSLRTGGNEPLYIVDGIPFSSTSLAQTDNAAYLSQISPFTSIRPEDIESIDVLRDADATAIYGSRGANGVILITTKRGTLGKTAFNFNVYQGINNIPKFYNLMNSAQFLEMRNEALRNDGRDPFPAETDMNGTWAPDNNINKNTDWQKILVGGTGKVTNASASLSGGDSLTQYIVGLSYRRETTVFPGDFANKIGSANASITHTSENRKLQLTTSINYSNNNNRLPTTDLTTFIFMQPNAPELYDANGNLNWQENTFENPLGFLYQKYNSIAENIIGTISAKYTLVNGLDLKANIGYNSLRYDETKLIPFISINPSRLPAEYERNITLARNEAKSWITEPQLSYTKAFGKHHLDALMAATFQSSERNGSTQSASGFSSDILIDNFGAGTVSGGSSSNSQYRYTAFFARVGYNYDEKYVLNLTGRRDGSTRFGPGEQFGNFGAIGAAWIFTKEDWLSGKVPVLSFGKLRASIGTTGNDQINDYDYISLYGAIEGYFGTSSLYPNRIGNPYYHWERINKIEGAMELGFIENLIKLTGSYYRNRTSNQLVGYNLPAITGFTSITANLPAVIQNNGTEITLSTLNINNENFNWSTSINLSVPRNKLVRYDKLAGSSYSTIYRIGYPLNIRLLYKYTGIDENTGIYTFEDVDKNGSLGEEDKYPFFIGPKLYGGINNSFSYKGFNLDIFFQLVKQDGLGYIGVTSPGSYSRAGSNMPVDFLDRWQKQGDKASYQKFGGNFGETSDAFTNYSSSDGAIGNASFIKLRNASFSWQLPRTWANDAKIRSAKVYVQGQNLLTITKFKGLDPEISAGGNSISLPVNRIITVGIQISL